MSADPLGEAMLRWFDSEIGDNAYADALVASGIPADDVVIATLRRRDRPGTDELRAAGLMLAAYIDTLIVGEPPAGIAEAMRFIRRK